VISASTARVSVSGAARRSLSAGKAASERAGFACGPGQRPSLGEAALDEPEVVALVNQAGAGDPAAFAALYERFLDPVYRYFEYCTGMHAEAEALTEQVYLKAWKAIGTFRWQGRPFLVWLYRLAHTVHLDYLRRPRAAVPLDRELDRQALGDQGAALPPARPTNADLLKRAIAQLSPEQQQVIVLRFAKGLDTTHIAYILDKQESAIWALQMRALQRGHELLRACPANGDS
jgi:RNA polymerase sigma-70 factor (ECF subfamily)